MSPEGRDRLGGAAMIVIGAAAAWRGAQYKLGTLTSMGPGFFPAAVGIGLAVAGLLIIVGGRLRSAAIVAHVPEQQVPAGPQWRGWICIALALASFVLLGMYVGLVPATLAVTFIAALGDRRNSLLHATVLALGVLAVCLIVFWWGLGLQFALFEGN